MNAYEFLRKVFGEDTVLSRNLYVQVHDRSELYRVVSINKFHVKLQDDVSGDKQIGRSSLLSVIGVSFIRSSVRGGRTLLTLRR